MIETFENVTKLFGEDPKSVQPEEFFSTITKFLDSFENARKDNARRAAEEEKRKKRQAALEEQESRRRAREARSNMPDLDNVQVDENLHGVMDEMIKRLKEEKGTRSRRRERRKMSEREDGTSPSSEDLDATALLAQLADS
eukprot:NODE_1694_length_768_cov_53.653666_g1645_i0.p1 GENE.NODE_1694_length_768_cov_53.653666_g1645_i0~~NODE_1694_length_768_cov_53.653666_g1645_i0.p1  ORF type:complete len:141 (+),score=24.76 NODE_1694_length_768_cov_53.653666_g1645_i0:238-660(+)